LISKGNLFKGQEDGKTIFYKAGQEPLGFVPGCNFCYPCSQATNTGHLGRKHSDAARLKIKEARAVQTVPRKTSEKYSQQLFEIHGDSLKLAGDYLGSRTPSLHQCDRGHEWLVMPTNALKGRTCPGCKGTRTFMGVPYPEIVKQVHGDSIKAIGTYTLNSTPIEHQCSFGHSFVRSPNYIKAGHGCPRCSQNARKTKEDYEKSLEEKYGDKIKAIEPYKSPEIPILHRCNNGHEFRSKPRVILLKRATYGCLECSGKKLKTQAQYDEDLLRVHQGKIHCLGSYQGTKLQLEHRCLKGHEWKSTPSSILRGAGCPCCAGQRPSPEIKASRDLGKNIRSRIHSEFKRKDITGAYNTSDSITLYVRSVIEGSIATDELLQIDALYKQSRKLKLTIDHIIPLCFANTLNPIDLAKVICFKNLRRLSNSENSRRSRNITMSEFLDPDLFTPWHIQTMEELTYTRYYFQTFDDWLKIRE